MRATLIIISLLSSFCSKAEDWAIFNSIPAGRFKVTATTPYKQIYNEALKYSVLKEDKNRLSNHFCLIGYDWPDGRRVGVVVWDEGPYIFYNWILGREPEEDDYSILYMSNVIDQNTMVFTPEKLRKLYTEEEIRRNPDIMPLYGYRQKDVDRLRSDCDKYGEKIIIPAFSAPQDCNDADDASNDPETRHFCEAMER